MQIIVVENTIPLEKLKEIGGEFYDTMIKGVVDIEKEIVAFGGQYHIDANRVLLDNSSEQTNIWGFNVNFDEPRESWIAYTSLINIRPLVGNRTMEVQDKTIRDRMKKIIDSKIT